MAKLDEDSKPNVVVGGNKLARLDKKWKQRPAIVVGVAVILLATVLLIILSVHQSTKNSKKTQDKAFQNMITQESADRNKNRDDLAKKLLLDFQSKYPKNNDKQQLNKISSELSAIYSSAKDYKKAQQWQTKALDTATNITFADYFNLAEACKYNGDKTCAISNYRKALDRLQHTDKPPIDQPLQVYINAQLKALGV